MILVLRLDCSELINLSLPAPSPGRYDYDMIDPTMTTIVWRRRMNLLDGMVDGLQMVDRSQRILLVGCKILKLITVEEN